MNSRPVLRLVPDLEEIKPDLEEQPSTKTVALRAMMYLAIIVTDLVVFALMVYGIKWLLGRVF